MKLRVKLSISTVLFDLDGTLLPMDNDEYTKGYFKLLAKFMAPFGYESKELIDAVWAATDEMVNNDGSQSNESAFWNKFATIYGEKGRVDKPIFDKFYATSFQDSKVLCGFNDLSSKVVKHAKEVGLNVALATNPIFPSIAIESRIRWAGLAPEDFSIYTTYENIGYCKPNLDYYLEIVSRMETSAAACLMVGNNVDDDMIAQETGMKVFLLTDNLINRKSKNINEYPNGDFNSLLQYIDNLMRE